MFTVPLFLSRTGPQFLFPPISFSFFSSFLYPPFYFVVFGTYILSSPFSFLCGFLVPVILFFSHPYCVSMIFPWPLLSDFPAVADLSCEDSPRLFFCLASYILCFAGTILTAFFRFPVFPFPDFSPFSFFPDAVSVVVLPSLYSPAPCL